MKISLPKGKCIYIGDDVSSVRKGADIVRDNKGNIVGSITVSNTDGYLGDFKQYASLTDYAFMYEHIAEVFFPVHYISNRVKNANFVIKRNDDDTVVWLETARNAKDRIVAESVGKFLTRPNCMQSFKEFVEQAFVYRYLTGNSYLYASGAVNSDSLWHDASQFYVLPSQNVVIELKSPTPLYNSSSIGEIISEYAVGYSGGQLHISPEFVMHSRDSFEASFGNNVLYGVSRLQSAERNISNLMLAYEARNVIYAKRGALGAIVSQKKDADTTRALLPNEKENIRKEFYDTYGVKSNKDPYAIIDVPVSFIKFGAGIEDLKPFEECTTDFAIIAGLYNLQSVLIPRKDNATFSNMREAEAKVYSSTILPDVKSWLDELNEWLGLREFGYYIDALWDDVEVLQEAKLTKENAMKNISGRCRSEFFAGVITLNDWRAQLDKERLDNELYDKTLLEMSDNERTKVLETLK